jgi:cell division septal protein FtsQ
VAVAGFVSSRVRSLALLVRFATVMAVLISAAAFLQSSFFSISDITVLGANRVDPADVLARSGLQRGQALASIDPRDVTSQLTHHPWIAGARLDVWPSGRVTIVIQERVPHAALPCAMWCRTRSRDSYVLVDHTGVALAIVPPPPSVPVITVEGATLAWVRPGDRVPSDAALSALRVLAVMPQTEIARGLRLHVDRTGAIRMTTADGITVLLGRPRGVGPYTASLPQVLTAIRRQRLPVRYVDLRFTGSVILKPAVPARGGVHR